MIRRRNDEAADRSTERRRQEDEAPRLLTVVPSLADLKLELEERRDGAPVAGSAHTKRVVVAHAPALFLVACGDRTCTGAHDLTRAVLRALERRETTFTGEDACRGDLPNGPCARVLAYRALAAYTP